MNLKPLVAASVLATACAAAFADDMTMNVPWVPDPGTAGAGSAGWGVTHIEAGAFTDTFTFTGLSDGVFSSSLVTIGFRPADNIDFTSISVNGQAYNLIGSGPGVEVANFSPQTLSGPIVLTVTGIAGPALADGTAISASYAGTANLAPVPEPETYALMLAGLGVVGMLGRRRLNG